ncbi:10318_t:CDS:2, partial [Cetraspora pellucida]
PNHLVYNNEEQIEELNFFSKKFKLTNFEINKLKQFYSTELNILKSRIESINAIKFEHLITRDGYQISCS